MERARFKLKSHEHLIACSFWGLKVCHGAFRGANSELGQVRLILPVIDNLTKSNKNRETNFDR